MHECNFCKQIFSNKKTYFYTGKEPGHITYTCSDCINNHLVGANIKAIFIFEKSVIISISQYHIAKNVSKYFVAHHGAEILACRSLKQCLYFIKHEFGNLKIVKDSSNGRFRIDMTGMSVTKMINNCSYTYSKKFLDVLKQIYEVKKFTLQQAYKIYSEYGLGNSDYVARANLIKAFYDRKIMKDGKRYYFTKEQL